MPEDFFSPHRSGVKQWYPDHSCRNNPSLLRPPKYLLGFLPVMFVISFQLFSGSSWPRYSRCHTQHLNQREGFLWGGGELRWTSSALLAQKWCHVNSRLGLEITSAALHSLDSSWRKRKGRSQTLLCHLLERVFQFGLVTGIVSARIMISCFSDFIVFRVPKHHVGGATVHAQLKWSALLF